MAVLIVSDLHITDIEDPLYRALIGLLDEASPGDTLVLAGDIFDLYVGNKRIYRSRYAAFFEALGRAGERRVELHYIEGNHDFHLRGAFDRIPGIKLHQESFSREIEGKRFFFAHGDRANASDYGYRALRALFRSAPFKGLAALLPGAAVERIGRVSSRYSRGHRPVLPCDFPADRRERLRNAYRSYAAEMLKAGHDFVVMGHCHDLDEMSFQIAGRAGQYINVGFPRVHGSVLSWEPGEEKIGRRKFG